jgi:hypothetical protein
MMEYAADVEDMEKKGFVYNNDRTVRNISKKQYLIDEVLFNSIVENKPIKVTPMKETQLDPLQFCVYIERLVSRRDDNDMSTRTLFSVIKEEEDKASLTLTKKLKKIFKDIADRVIFYVVICNFLKTDTKECTTIDNLMDNLYDYIPDRARIGRLLNSENHPLMKAGLIELIASNYLALTDDGCQLLFGNNASLWMEQTCNLDRYAFVNTVQELIEKISVESKNYLVKLEKKITKLENHSPELTVIQNLKDTVPSPIDRTLFYLVAKDMTEGCEFNLQSELCKIYNCKKDEFLIRAKFKDGTHILQKNKLVELSNKGLFNDAGLNLTDKGKEIFLEDDVDLFSENAISKNIITPENITVKHLFFDNELRSQLDMVRNSLLEENYKNLRSRLMEKSLSPGIAVLLYGAPGTGKTESVMQIAHETGRSIIHVDISQTKSCWFGESEKIIKDVFSQYKCLCRKSKLKPILFFNEADAIFSKRKDSNSSNVAQTENTIQNIILEELEQLDGILVATTNLATNLDRAFERRFLFKIKFNKPSEEAKLNIWKDKLPILNSSEARTLASTYDFSGGEIDNIVRKATMKELLEGHPPSLDTLLNFCQEEHLTNSSTKKIGFA